MKNLLKNACEELKINITEEQIEKFMKYKDILLNWNENINLTAITEESEIILKHFVDSLTPLIFRNFEKTKIIDVGTGAGFPALPIKIFSSSSNVTLLDSLNKRINFLKEVSNSLSIENVSFIHSRAEDSGQNSIFREKFDFCISRAVANLSVLAEYDLPFVKIGGEFIALKGNTVEEEILTAKNAIKILGGEISDIKTVKIPFTEINHKLVFIKKLRQTPNKYPRKAGKISKNPIK